MKFDHIRQRLVTVPVQLEDRLRRRVNELAGLVPHAVVDDVVWVVAQHALTVGLDDPHRLAVSTNHANEVACDDGLAVKRTWRACRRSVGVSMANKAKVARTRHHALAGAVHTVAPEVAMSVYVNHAIELAGMVRVLLHDVADADVIAVLVDLMAHDVLHVLNTSAITVGIDKGLNAAHGVSPLLAGLLLSNPLSKPASFCHELMTPH